MGELYAQDPGALDIRFVHGDEFNMAITFKDSAGTVINLTGYTFNAEIDVNGVATQLTVTPIDLTGGKITLNLQETPSAALPPGFYTWKMEWMNGGITKTILAGNAEVL